VDVGKVSGLGMSKVGL